MLTVIGAALKLVIGDLLSGVAYVIERWRVFLPVAIVALTLWYIHTLRSARDAALVEHAALLADIAEAQRGRQILNLVIEQRLALELAQASATHAQELDTLLEHYNAAQKDKTTAVATAADLRRQLRDTLQAATTARLPDDRAGSLRPPESRRECDSAGPGYDAAPGYLDDLEYACAVTTADYNSLWLRCDAAVRAANGTQ